MTLEEIQAELGRQDEALATAMKQIQDLGDVQIQMPEALLREIDDACTVHVSSSNPNYLTGLRA